MFEEMTNLEMMQVEGGIGLLGAIGIGALCLLGGTGLGLGTAYVVSKL
ncbi:MAG: class IIb bacteriocin, lactobin A/cerein 7B family [Lachnospiraceae bacterium]|nr:class IIb bacteriocin, lactobin A/cerein 7B family [Lachnospiraceae bacterium]